MRVLPVLVALSLVACATETKKTCPADQILEKGECVSRCAKGEVWRDGECAPSAASLLARLESARDETCACADDACRGRARASVVMLLEAVRSSKSGASSAELERAKAAEAAVATCTGAGEEKDVVESLAAIEKKMCACKDKGCAGAASAEFDRWMTSPAGRAASKTDKDRVLAISKSFTACMNAAME